MHEEAPQNTDDVQEQAQIQQGVPSAHLAPQQDDCEAYRSQIIISEQNANQILTVILEPDQNMWYRGQVIASNRAHTSKQARGYENFDLDRFLHLFKMRWNLPSKLSNSGPDMAYFCLQRRGGGGKILYLDHNIYKQEFVVNLNKLLTINCDPLNIQPKPVSQLPYLSRLVIKQNTNISPLCISLQSNPGNLIYQKSLGPSQKLYIGSSQIIAMSNRVQAKRNQNQIVLTGPGFVFIQSASAFNSSSMQMQGQVQINALLGILVMIIFTLMMIIGYLQ